MNRKKWIFAALLLSLNVISAVGHSQTRDQHETVTSRARPGLDGSGAAIGAFILLPTVDLDIVHDSDIFADDTNRVSDLITVVTPAISLMSDWNRHEIAVGGHLASARYSDFGNEDYDDAAIWAKGRLDIGDGRLDLLGRYSNLHEDRTEVDDVNGIVPTEFTSNSASVTYSYRPNKISLRAKLSFDDLIFSNTQTRTGLVNNSDRERSTLEGIMRVGYRLSPGYSLFVEVRDATIEYDQFLDDAGFARSSERFQTMVGGELDLSNVTFGEFYFGYRTQEYDDARFAKSDGGVFGANITWNPTPLTTVTFAAQRSTEPTTVFGSSGIKQTRWGTNVDHELLRNVILRLAVSGESDTFEQSDREDDSIRTTVGGRYLLSRYLHLSLSYDYQHRKTSAVTDNDFEYNKNRILLRLHGQY